MIGDALTGAISGAIRGLSGALGGVQGVKLTVSQDNVMHAARIVKAEAEYFRGCIRARMQDMEVTPMGDDPVSNEVARVLTSKLVTSADSYVNRCREYADMLDLLADQLAESARTYGFTEQQVADIFTAAERDAELRTGPSRTSRGHGLAPV